MQDLLIPPLHQSPSLQLYLPLMKFSVPGLWWQSHFFLFSYLLCVIIQSRVSFPRYHCRPIFCFLLMLSPSQSKLAHPFLGILNILLLSPSRTILGLHYKVLLKLLFSGLPCNLQSPHDHTINGIFLVFEHVPSTKQSLVDLSLDNFLSAELKSNPSY